MKAMNLQNNCFKTKIKNTKRASNHCPMCESVNKLSYEVTCKLWVQTQYLMMKCKVIIILDRVISKPKGIIRTNIQIRQLMCKSILWSTRIREVSG